MIPLLRVEELSVEYRRDGHALPVVRGVSLEVGEGETLGVVGESGCGKSSLALALLRLLPDPGGRVTGGRVLWRGEDVLRMDDAPLRRLRGGGIGMVFQDPFSALNPVLTVGDQIEETVAAHASGLTTGNRRARVLELIGQVRLSDAERVARAYPHQLSGGQRQRAGLAIALAGRPSLLVADEPTTALDVTIQREILDLLDALKAEARLAMLFITHNLGLVAERTDRLAVMYAGEIVETGPTADLLRAPRHPYTKALLRSLPTLHKTAALLPTIPGQPPDPRGVPPGCPFHPRCAEVFAPCATRRPDLLRREGRDVACHLYDEKAAVGR